MIHFLASRLASALIVLFGVSCVVFLFIHMVPGDPVEVMLGESAGSSEREALRTSLGLDQPLVSQFRHYFTAISHGDLGTSLHSQRPVVELLVLRFPATAELAAAALCIALVLALPLGVTAALHRGSGWDRGTMALALLGMSVPSFWLGPLLALFFAVGLGLLPVSGREGLTSIILPALTLGIGMAAILARMLRASLLEILSLDYIRTAYAKGLPTTRVIWLHALPNAALPVITLLGLQLGGLLSGAVITETIFSWPGIGSLMVEAINRRDYPVVQGCVLLISLTYVGVNTLTDLACAALDPRIRLGANQ